MVGVVHKPAFPGSPSHPMASKPIIQGLSGSRKLQAEVSCLNRLSHLSMECFKLDGSDLRDKREKCLPLLFHLRIGAGKQAFC